MRIVWPGAVALVLLVPGAAGATDKRACVAASDEAQRLRSRGQLLAARAELVACTDAGCPSIVREACAGWLNEVATAMPSVVLTAKEVTSSCDPAGAPVVRELVDAEVSIDGRPFRGKLDGHAAELDPGPHVLRLRAGGAPGEQRIVVQEGAKLRPIAVTLDGPAPICIRRDVPAQTAGLPTGAIVAAAISAVSWGTFGYFAVQGNSQYHALLGTCGPSCGSEPVSRVTTDFVVADVALGLGIVAVGVATWLLLAPQRHLTVGPTRQGALLRVAF